MKHVKLFEAFSTPKPLSEEQISWLDECAGGSWRLNPSTGLIDVKGYFNCAGQGLKDFKGVRFGHVKGDFSCDNNQLTSLEGAPKTVNGNFHCYYNQLTSLKGAPETVDGYFHCANNQLTSLEGAPNTIKDDFNCDNNQLTSLEGAPKTVDGSFYCYDNQLTSLKGAPETVDKDFNCSGNQLTSLEGAPKTVNAGFNCADNPLKSLVGAPESVGIFSISVWPGISTLDWKKGWSKRSKKGDKEFTKTLISKLKEINALGSDADKGKLISMLISLTNSVVPHDLLEYLLSLTLSTSDKFEVYGAIKANMPDVWDKIRDKLDPEGATSDLLDLGF